MKAIRELEQLVYTRLSNSLAKHRGSPALVGLLPLCAEGRVQTSSFVSEDTTEKNT